MANIIPLSNRDDERTTTQGTFPSPDDMKFVRKTADWWKEADDSSKWLKEEQKEHDFSVGHQWDGKDYEAIKKSGRYPLVLNKTLGHLLLVSGHERSNRMRVRYLPVEQSDTESAEIWTEVGRIVQEQGNVDWNKSDAFFSMLKGGRGFVGLRMDYTRNPAGDLLSDCISPWELRIDPTHTEYELDNARYVIWEKQVSLETLILLWPEKADEILAAQQTVVGKDSLASSVSDRDSDYDSLASRSYDKITKKWSLREVWYWQVEKTAEFLVQGQDGQWQPIIEEDELKIMLLENPELVWKRSPQYERKYYQAFVCGPLLLENNPSYLDYKGYPFVPFYGIWDDKQGRWLGLAYHLTDPQIEVNKRRTQVLHIINRAAKSGWKGPKGSFVDRDKWEKQSGLPGVILEYEVEPNIAPPQEITPDTIPTAFIQMEQMAKQDFHDISLVNLELMGLGQKDTPGIVVNQRQRQALIGLQIYYDNMRRSTKILGRLMLSMMQQFYADGRQFSIPGKQVTLDETMQSGRYDLVVEEAPWSPNQKMETAAKLESAIQIAANIGAPIPPDVLDYMDLPETLTQKWKALIEQRMSQGQTDPRLEMEQMKLQLQTQELKIKEFSAYFDALLKTAQAEAAEAGTQLQGYNAFVNQHNVEQDRQAAQANQAQQNEMQRQQMAQKQETPQT